MFDMIEAIKQWRDNLEQGESMAKPDLDELESHLRDQLEELRNTGLSEEEAFWVGTHRLGDTEVIQQEYTKVDHSTRWNRRLFWMASGSLFFYMLVHFSFACGDLLVMAGILYGIRGVELAVVNSIGMFSSMIFTLLLFYLGFKRRWIEICIRFFLPGGWKRALVLAILVTTSVLVITFSPYFLIPLKTSYLNPADYNRIQVFRYWSLAIWTTACPLVLVFVLYKLNRYRVRNRRENLVVE